MIEKTEYEDIVEKHREQEFVKNCIIEILDDPCKICLIRVAYADDYFSPYDCGSRVYASDCKIANEIRRQIREVMK